MLFLEHDDRQLVVRRLAPQAREQSVAEDLRGWTWHRPPLSPIYDPPLDVAEVAGDCCPTGRDLYLTRVLDVPVRLTPDELRERALRAALVQVVSQAKQTIYLLGAAAAAEVAVLAPPPLGRLLAAESPVPSGLAEQVQRLWSWEAARLAARIGETAAAFPGAAEDTLAALAIPVTAGRRIDGRFLGLSAALEADGLSGPVAPVVFAVRFAPPRPVDRLLTTGMAMALEAAHDAPVDLGCVVYGGFSGGHLTVRRDLHVIDDELRQQFIELRDERARLVQEEIDPGLPAVCPEDCRFRPVCLKGG